MDTTKTTGPNDDLSPQPKVKPLGWESVGEEYWTAVGASGEYEVMGIGENRGYSVIGPGASHFANDELSAKSIADQSNATEVASWLDLER